MILSFFSSQGWESWDSGHRPLIPERMPVLVDDDLLLEDGPGAPRPTVAVNQWLRELPASGAHSPGTWRRTRVQSGCGRSSWPCTGWGCSTRASG